MANTEADVRAAVVAGIKGIYATLGFKTSPGNVHEYLLDKERKGKLGDYLATALDGVTPLRIRAWGVEVLAHEEYFAVREIPTRHYSITVQGYYGAHGTNPVNTLIDHARHVRKAIYDLTSRISSTVDRTVAVTDVEIERLDNDEIPDEVYVGTFVYTAEKYNPGWTND